MIAIVKQGRSEARVEVADQGISFADVICTALGYGSIELQSVLFTPGNHDPKVIEAGRGTYQIGYTFTKGSGLFVATVEFEAAS